jgi:hypothetical protein
MIYCHSQCKLSRYCLRHHINAPTPRESNVAKQYFEPEYEEDCCGFINLLEEILDDDSTKH